MFEALSILAIENRYFFSALNEKGKKNFRSSEILFITS